MKTYNPSKLSLRRLRFCCLILCLSWLSGCSQIIIPQGSSSAHQQQLDTLEHWDIKGKIAIAKGKERNSGYLTWQQDYGKYDIYIAGPFGAKASRLQGSPTQASMLLHGWQQPAIAPSAETLMDAYLGWVFPVASLRYWVKGQPAPKGKAKVTFDEHGFLSSLRQDGWTISYSRYQAQGEHWLPGLIRLHNPDYTFTLAISSWTLYEH